jgi:hypothetical protein
LALTATISPSSGAFDHADLVALCDHRLHFGQFDKHHIAKRRGCVFRDADHHQIAFDPQPFVFFRVLHHVLSV